MRYLFFILITLALAVLLYGDGDGHHNVAVFANAQEHNHNHFVYSGSLDGTSLVKENLHFCSSFGIPSVFQIGASGEDSVSRSSQPILLGIAHDPQRRAFKFCMAMPTRGWLAFGIHGGPYGDAMEEADIWQFAAGDVEGQPPKRRDAYGKINGQPITDSDAICGGQDDLKDVELEYNATARLTVVRWSRAVTTPDDERGDRRLDAQAGFVRAIWAHEGVSRSTRDFAHTHTHRVEGEINNPSRSDEVWVDFGAVVKGTDAPLCVGKHVECRPVIPEGVDEEKARPQPLQCPAASEKDTKGDDAATPPSPKSVDDGREEESSSGGGKKGANGGAIAGGIFGVLGAIGVGVGAFIWHRRRQREKRMRGWLEMSNTGFDLDTLDDDDAAF